MPRKVRGREESMTDSGCRDEWDEEIGEGDWLWVKGKKGSVGEEEVREEIWFWPTERETVDQWPAEEGNQEFSKAKATFSLVWLTRGELVMESHPDEGEWLV
ncbi:hypothetical protein D5086_008608 [Populus alba]|uniref:Uncharacterized protein n=1 Tax=Populus alba TaxID=43335 RepID=A0ACC4CGY1_POPAL